METITGFVQKLNVKNGVNQTTGLPWTAYSIIVQLVDGTVLPKWYQFGFEQPGFAQGDYISFSAIPSTKNPAAMVYVEGTGTKPKNPPARPAAPVAATGANGAAGKPYVRKVTKSALFGDIGGYYSEDDISRMTLSTARDSAVELVSALIDAKGLPMSESSAKAGQAKRYAEIIAMVDKLTVKFYYDNATRRILADVDDEGAVTATEQPLPADADEAPVVEVGETLDGEPFGESTPDTDAPERF